MEPKLKLYPRRRTPDNGVYLFSFGRVRGSFYFSAENSSENEEWIGVSVVSLRLRAHSASVEASLQRLEEKQGVILVNGEWLVRESISPLGSGAYPPATPGPLPRIPREIAAAYYPRRSVEKLGLIIESLNSALLDLYLENTLVRISESLACGIGPSLRRIRYAFSLEEKPSLSKHLRIAGRM